MARIFKSNLSQFLKDGLFFIQFNAAISYESVSLPWLNINLIIKSIPA